MAYLSDLVQTEFEGQSNAVQWVRGIGVEVSWRFLTSNDNIFYFAPNTFYQ